jgi:hypothetical protein
MWLKWWILVIVVLHLIGYAVLMYRIISMVRRRRKMARLAGHPLGWSCLFRNTHGFAHALLLAGAMIEVTVVVAWHHLGHEPASVGRVHQV